MPSAKDVMLSVAQVCDLEPGTDAEASWINPGFTGVVRTITQKKTKAGKFFYPCIIADQTGPETIEVSFFTAPKFSEGDVIDIHGKGLRRTEYNGKAQASIGKDTEITVVGQSAHHGEQVQRAATGAPAVNGHPQLVQGQTVGMAVKEALAMVGRGDLGALNAKEPEYWQAVHEVASDIIRVSRLLEKGKLAASVRERNTQEVAPPPPDRSGQPAAYSKPKPGPDGQAFNSDGEEIPMEDVPF